jgi:hypothetical protein
MEPYSREYVPEELVESAANKQIYASWEREAVLKKFQSLQSNTRLKDEALEKLFRPVTKAIKLGSEKVKPTPTEAETQTTKEEEPDEIKTLRDIDDVDTKVFGFNALPSTQIFDTPEYNKSLKRKKKLDSSYEDIWRIQTQFGHHLRDRDVVFGPHYEKTADQWRIGRSEVDIDNTVIKIGDANRFPKTPGLLELLFEKIPLQYTNDDKANYASIIRATGLHLTRRGAPKRPEYYKYQSIIAPFLREHAQKESHTPARSPPAGKGIRFVPHTTNQWKRDYGGDNRIDYKYYKHPQELVDRALLLLAEREAGHRGHDNELWELETELRSIGILE